MSILEKEFIKINKKMEGINPNSLEKVGIGLACSVETFRGCNIQLVKRTSGFNGLSTNKDGEVRKIEVKTMQNSFNWIAISSIIGIDKLFFERDYWIYFVLVPHNYVVMVKGFPFLKKQMNFVSNEEFMQNLNEWMRYTKRISKGTGLKFLPKLQLKFPTPINKLIEYLIANPDATEWQDSVIEIWQNQSSWQRLYNVKEKE
jgi:hypothetical protein